MNQIFKFKIYPTALKIIKILHKNHIKIGLVSGSNKEFVSKIINKHFKGMFDVIITGNDVKKGKPNPESYIKAIKKLNLDTKHILVIENAPLGIKSAKKAKLKIYALATTLDKQFLKEANKIFNSHIELLNELKNII